MINRSSTIEIVVVEQGWDRDESCNVRIFEIVGRYLRVPALDEYGNFTRFIGGGGEEEEEEIERPPSVGRVGYTSLSGYRVFFSLSRRARRSSSQGWGVINNDSRSNVLINIGSIIVILLRVMKRNLVWEIFFIALFVFDLFDLFVDNCN